MLLINPPLDAVIRNGNVSPVTSYLFYNSAPLGILYIAAVLERNGYEVGAIDSAAELIDVPATVKRVEEFKPDVIGIGATTVIFHGALELAQALKEALPGVPIVLGGWHVNVMPEDAMRHECFDVGVIGEGEFTMLELMEFFKGTKSLEDVQGILFRRPDGEGFHHTPARPKFQDLDSLPYPARHLLPPNIYQPVPIDEHGLPKFAMVSSRGCPHSCAFCQKARTGYRSHSPRYIVDEMEHLIRDYGVKDIAIVDSLFCLNKKRVMAVCDEMIRRRIGDRVSWTCSSRVEVVDKEMLQRMRDAGCWRTRFGIESGNDRVLEFISKGITKEKIRDAITWADEVGLRPKAFFMVGHLPDTAQSIEETIEFALSIPLHDVTVQINTLLPETPNMDIWERDGAKYGRIVNPSTDEKSFWEPTYVPWGLEQDDLIRYHREFYRRFYFRPVVLKRHLNEIHSWRDVAKYAQATSLFSFLFYNRDKMNLSTVKEMVRVQLGGEERASA